MDKVWKFWIWLFKEVPKRLYKSFPIFIQSSIFKKITLLPINSYSERGIDHLLILKPNVPDLRKKNICGMIFNLSPSWEPQCRICKQWSKLGVFEIWLFNGWRSAICDCVVLVFLQKSWENASYIGTCFPVWDACNAMYVKINTPLFNKNSKMKKKIDANFIPHNDIPLNSSVHLSVLCRNHDPRPGTVRIHNMRFDFYIG